MCPSGFPVDDLGPPGGGDLSAPVAPYPTQALPALENVAKEHYTVGVNATGNGTCPTSPLARQSGHGRTGLASPEVQAPRAVSTSRSTRTSPSRTPRLRQEGGPGKESGSHHVGGLPASPSSGDPPREACGGCGSPTSSRGRCTTNPGARLGLPEAAHAAWWHLVIPDERAAGGGLTRLQASQVVRGCGDGDL